MWLIYMMLIASPRPHYSLRTPRDCSSISLCGFLLWLDSKLHITRVLHSIMTLSGLLVLHGGRWRQPHSLLVATCEESKSSIRGKHFTKATEDFQRGHVCRWSWHHVRAVLICSAGFGFFPVLIKKKRQVGTAPNGFPGLSLFGSLPILSYSHLLWDTWKLRLFLSKNGCMECLMILCPVSQ